MIRIYIIEDHLTVVVSGFRFLFRPNRDGITVTGCASTVEEAVGNANPASIDLFILDLHIPGHLPLENFRILKRAFPGKPILIYTADSSTAWMRKMIDEGASGYLTKDVTREELKSAIQRVSRGEVICYASGNGSSVIPDNMTSGPPFLSMSPVQIEIASMLARGISHKEISKQLELSRSSVEKILQKLRTNLKVKNNLELVSRLTQKGVIG